MPTQEMKGITKGLPYRVVSIISFYSSPLFKVIQTFNRLQKHGGLHCPATSLAQEKYSFWTVAVLIKVYMKSAKYICPIFSDPGDKIKKEILSLNIRGSVNCNETL